MADAFKKVTVHTQQDDFYVTTEVALAKLMDPTEIAEGDLWSFVNNGGEGLVIVRRRVTTTEYPDPTVPEEPPAEEPPPEEVP